MCATSDSYRDRRHVRRRNSLFDFVFVLVLVFGIAFVIVLVLVYNLIRVLLRPLHVRRIPLRILCLFDYIVHCTSDHVFPPS